MKNKSRIQNQGHRMAAGFFGHREIEAKERQATSTGGANPQLTEKFQEAEKGEAREKTDQEHKE
ncbi:MAG: hypothetical protein IH886_00925 [Nitrospinae bacterium]|nr:hypothetical protein [Nitrospinota bacterium]